jgi:pyruvate/oxaloacetate carboxyltransferase
MTKATKKETNVKKVVDGKYGEGVSVADQVNAILLAVDGLTTAMKTMSTSTAADIAEVIKLLGRIKRDAP